MLATLRKHYEREDEGFTLIELMVVVLIIAILLAIAIPTFLGARERANERAAQSSLRNALTAAKTLYTDSQTYLSATSAALPAVEPSLQYQPGNTVSDDYKEVSVNPVSKDVWFGSALAKNNKCFQIRDVTSSTGGGTTYYKFASNSTGTSPACSGDEALANTASFAANGW